MQVRFLMLNTMCLTSLHNIQQDLINFIPGFSSLLMQMIFFLLLKQTVPNSDTCYFRARVIYIYTNPMVTYELMRIRHIRQILAQLHWPSLQRYLLFQKGKIFGSARIRNQNSCVTVNHSNHVAKELTQQRGC